VANARANPHAILADGRRRTRITLVEVDVEQRRHHLLLAQLTNEPDIGNLLVRSGLVTSPESEAVASAANRIAVFRIEPSAGAN
jgi:hypothetical protein